MSQFGLRCVLIYLETHLFFKVTLIFYSFVQFLFVNSMLNGLAFKMLSEFRIFLQYLGVRSREMDEENALIPVY